MERQKVLVVSEEGFSWFLVASALDRRSLVLEWHRSAGGIADAARAFAPDLVVVGDIGGTSEGVTAACREVLGAGFRVVALALLERDLDAGALREAGVSELLHVGAGTDEIRARLLDHLGLDAAREPRVRVARPAALRVGDLVHAGTTVDLGPGGALLRLLGTVRPGDEGRVTIEIGASGTVECRARVLRVTEDAVAVRFEGLGDREKDRLTAMARRGARELPSLFDGSPRLVDVVLQARQALVDGDPAGPVPSDWLEPQVERLSDDEKTVLRAFDPSAWTTHREEDDDRALLVGARLLLAFCSHRLKGWEALSTASQARLFSAARANLLAAERVFKEAAVRGAVRRGDGERGTPEGGRDPLEAAQWAVLEVALPVRDRFNALAGDKPVSAFPALQVPDDYFRSSRVSRVRHDPSAYRTRERNPHRAEFAAVALPAQAPIARRKGWKHPVLAGTLGAVAALALVAAAMLGGGRASPARLTADQVARFGGLVTAGRIEDGKPRALLAEVDAARWEALDPAGREAALDGVRERLAGLAVDRATLIDGRGRLVAVVGPSLPASAASGR